MFGENEKSKTPALIRQIQQPFFVVSNWRCSNEIFSQAWQLTDHIWKWQLVIRYLSNIPASTVNYNIIFTALREKKSHHKFELGGEREQDSRHSH